MKSWYGVLLTACIAMLLTGCVNVAKKTDGEAAYISDLIHFFKLNS